MPDDARPPGLLQRATRRLPFLRPASPVGRYHRDLALSFLAYTAVLLPPPASWMPTPTPNGATPSQSCR